MTNHFNYYLTLHKAFNYIDGFSKSSYEATKYTRALGFDYVKIDACVNHCILFRKGYALAKQCPKCGAPRWKEGFVQGGDIDADDNGYCLLYTSDAADE